MAILFQSILIESSVKSPKLLTGPEFHEYNDEQGIKTGIIGCCKLSGPAVRIHSKKNPNNMKTRPLTKILLHIFLAVLILHISVFFSRTEWMCQCDKGLKKTSICCNCPKCPNKKDELLTSCCSSDLKVKEENKTVVLKMAGCLCGSSNTVLNLPSSNNTFIPSEHADYFSHLREYSFKTEIIISLLEEPIAPIDHPG